MANLARPRPCRTAQPLRSLAAVLLVGGIGVAGCTDRSLPERLRTEIAAYRNDPSPARAADIEADFSELDAQVKRLEADAARSEGAARDRARADADRLAATRDGLREQWNDARIDRAVGAAKHAVESVGSSIGNAMQEAGKKIEGAFKGSGGEAPPR